MASSGVEGGPRHKAPKIAFWIEVQQKFKERGQQALLPGDLIGVNRTDAGWLCGSSWRGGEKQQDVVYYPGTWPWKHLDDNEKAMSGDVRRSPPAAEATGNSLADSLARLAMDHPPASPTASDAGTLVDDEYGGVEAASVMDDAAVSRSKSNSDRPVEVYVDLPTASYSAHAYLRLNYFKNYILVTKLDELRLHPTRDFRKLHGDPELEQDMDLWDPGRERLKLLGATKLHLRGPGDWQHGFEHEFIVFEYKKKYVEDCVRRNACEKFHYDMVLGSASPIVKLALKKADDKKKAAMTLVEKAAVSLRPDGPKWIWDLRKSMWTLSSTSDLNACRKAAKSSAKTSSYYHDEAGDPCYIYLDDKGL